MNKKSTIDSIVDPKGILLTLIDNLPQVFWLVSFEEPRKIEYISPSFEKILGIPVEDVYKKPSLWMEMIHKDDRNYVLSKLESLTQDNNKYQVRYRIARKDGTIRWISERGFLIKDSNGKINKFAGISEDITHSIETEEKAKENEERIQTVYRAVPIGMGIVLNRTFTFVNDIFCDMLGYSREELIGNSSRMIYPTEEDYKYVGSEKYALIEKYGSGSIETVFKTKKGKILNVILSSSRVDEKNPNKGTIFAVLDITDIKKTEEKIQTVYKAVPMAMGVVVKRTFTFVNDIFCDMLGYSREEFIGNNSRMMYPTEEDYEYVGRKNYGFGSIETRLRTKTGIILNVILSSSRIDQSDPDKGVIFTVLDITNRKKDEERIHALNDNLKLLNKILRHDIANNLTIVNIALEMIKTENSDLKNKAFTAIKRSIDLIEKIRALESTMSVKDDLKPISTKNITYSINRIYPNININVKGECNVIANEALNLVIDNIVSNAITHGKTDKIDIEIDPQDSNCEIRIIDYGKGISDKIKDHIFEESFSHGTSRGTGLGLYIVKKTIERYGGEIKVFDTKPSGATFVITLKKAE